MMKRLLRIGFFLFTLCALLAVLSACVADPGNTIDATTTEPITEHLHVPKIEPGSEPTCTSEGWGDRVYCAECGETLEEAKILPPRKHELVWHDSKDPTCLESGWNAYETCNNCDYTTYEALEPTSHVTLWHEPKEPTCTESGWEGYETCLLCEYTTYRELPATDHSLEYHTGMASTCEQGGYAPFEACIHCDYTTYTELAPLGHIEEYHEARAATCEENGWYAYVTCAREGCALDTKMIDDPLGHDKIPHEATEPTCSENGHTAYESCSRCDRLWNFEEIWARGHHYQYVPGVPATCEEAGIGSGYRCLRCDHVLDGFAPIAALGHDMIQNEALAPTCTKDGHSAYEACSRCEKQSEITSIPALGHDMVKHTGKEPTCTEAGWYEYETCSRCDAYSDFGVVREALGHLNDIRVELRPATCVTPQLVQVTCSRCLTLIGNFESYTDSNAHAVVIDEAVPPTCVSSGLTEGRHCELCDKVFLAQKVVPSERAHTTQNGACIYCHAGESTKGLEYIPYEDGYMLVGLGDYKGDTLVIGTYNNRDVVAVYLEYERTNRTQIKTLIFAEGSRCNDDDNLGFHQWTGLETVIFKKNSSTLIRFSMFSDCTSLKEVIFEEGCEFVPSEYLDRVPSIGSHAFYGCTSLTSLRIPSTIQRINTSAFLSCTSLTELYIPASVTEIASSVVSTYGNQALTVYIEHAAAPGGWATSWKDSVPTVWGCRSNSVADDGYIYTVQNGIRYALKDGEATVATQPRNQVAVSIPASIAYGGRTYPVKAIAESAFAYAPLLSSVTMGDLITHIGSTAFQNCNNLTSVTLSATLKSIGYEAFCDCHNLTEITIPGAVTEIGGFAFEDCVALTVYAECNTAPSGWASAWNAGCPVVYDCRNNDKSQSGYAYIVQNGIRYALKDGEATVAAQRMDITIANIPSYVTYNGERYIVTGIGNEAFHNHENLVSVSIPATVRSIAASAFHHCSRLEEVTFETGSACREFSDYAFAYCPILRAFALPSALEYIGASAFDGCASITEITLPATVDFIGYAAFRDCGALRSVCFAAGSTCTEIERYAFYGCSSLSSFVIPASVTSIGEGVFAFCESLASLTVESGSDAYRAEGNALYTMDGKTLLAYAAKSPVTSLTVPEGVTLIGEYAFTCAGLLESIKLPSSLYTLKQDAFLEATAPAFYAIGGVRYADTWVIGYDGITTDVAIREGTVGFALSVFTGNATMRSLVIPASLTRIPEGTFGECRALERVTFAKDSRCVSIDTHAFSNCSSLLTIEIPKSVTEIGESAFANCISLTTVTFAEGNACKAIRSTAFYNCTSLTGITLPASVIELGASVFSNAPVCRIVDGVHYVGAWAVGITIDNATPANTVFSILEGTIGIAPIFANYPMVESVSIPASVIYIMDAAFRNCAALYEITVSPDNPSYRSIDGNLYSKDGRVLIQYAPAKAATSFTVPEGVNTIAKEAFYRANNLISVNLTGVERIGEDAFFDCQKLKSVTLSSSLTAIEEGAFSFCKNLSSVSTIPATVTEMGTSIFYRCESLKVLHVNLSEKPDAWDENWSYSPFHSITVYWNGIAQ